MKKVGIALIILQILAVFGGLINGSFIEMITGIRNVTDIFEIFGFFICGIVGLILLLNVKRKESTK